MAGPRPGDRGQLVGLRSRPDLNGRRVEVKGEAAGKDGAPRFAVRLLFGAGAGTVLKVKAANLELDKDRTLDDPAMATLVAEMQALAPGAVPEEERRDWAGLPEELLVKVAGTLVAQTEAGWAAHLKECKPWMSEEEIQKEMAKRKRDGNCLFVFARVCKEWRKAQLKVGGPLCTRVRSDVILQGRVALVKWALAEGCPRQNEEGFSMAMAAARYSHDLELVKWLFGEGGFAMDAQVIADAAVSGSLEVVQWLRGEGCPWTWTTCDVAVQQGHVEVLRWARENGAPWAAQTRDWAADKFGYTDDFGNLEDPPLPEEEYAGLMDAAQHQYQQTGTLPEWFYEMHGMNS